MSDKNAKLGLFIVVPVVLIGLVYGIYKWPKGKSVDELLEHNAIVRDSIGELQRIQKK